MKRSLEFDAEKNIIVPVEIAEDSPEDEKEEAETGPLQADDVEVVGRKH